MVLKMIPKLQSDLKQAQLDRAEVSVSTLRMLISEINNAKIAKGEDLTDQDIILVVQRESKKRKESIEAFRRGGREESARKEELELKILVSYLPTQLSDEELTSVVEEAITELEAKGLIAKVGAASLTDMGKVIGMVMSKAVGQADGGRVSSLVKIRLSR